MDYPVKITLSRDDFGRAYKLLPNGFALKDEDFYRVIYHNETTVTITPFHYVKVVREN